MKNYVITIFFLPTTVNSLGVDRERYSSGEIISTLASNAGGREFVDWIVVDGPGSGNLQDPMLWVEPWKYNTVTGQLFGKGLEEGVRHAQSIIRGKKTQHILNLEKEELSVSKYNKLKKYGVQLEKDKYLPGIKKEIKKKQGLYHTT
ncbi:hypothetical protein Cyrtocomes_00796 [Candidatus Cyrtobacter comes]|uniref:Uncharacterized protein n=1 Tax=Candidatus Cyrtobacter comes TaxID=675776 RepID=A0ABU5L8G7_9RICK|nr:hypothetical protein [Candidatus Cyrtobacter comes]MDZ5762416.1 hypothetical protein [Candidatus Cyrtobacter comes]